MKSFIVKTVTKTLPSIRNHSFKIKKGKRIFKKLVGKYLLDREKHF